MKTIKFKINEVELNNNLHYSMIKIKHYFKRVEVVIDRYFNNIQQETKTLFFKNKKSFNQWKQETIISMEQNNEQSQKHY